VERLQDRLYQHRSTVTELKAVVAEEKRKQRLMTVENNIDGKLPMYGMARLRLILFFTSQALLLKRIRNGETKMQILVRLSKQWYVPLLTTTTS
jgi:hypothetical protein